MKSKSIGQEVVRRVKKSADAKPYLSNLFLPLSPKSEPFDRTKILLTHWNVNGLGAKLSNPEKYFETYLSSKPFDIICFNETKLTSHSFEKLNLATHSLWEKDFHQFWSFSTARKGYSGTTVLTKIEPLSIKSEIGIQPFDSEGRLLVLEFASFYLIAVYVPNSGAELARLQTRIVDWDYDFREFIAGLRRTKEVVVLGDMNVAHQPIDLKFPERNAHVAGYTLQERESFQSLLDEGFVDVWREMNPNKIQYTFWSGRVGESRTNGHGWRLDYCLASQRARKMVEDVVIRDDVFGSDHCPVEVVLDLDKLTKK